MALTFEDKYANALALANAGKGPGRGAGADNWKPDKPFKTGYREGMTTDGGGELSGHGGHGFTDKLMQLADAIGNLKAGMVGHTDQSGGRTAYLKTLEDLYDKLLGQNQKSLRQTSDLNTGGGSSSRGYSAPAGGGFGGNHNGGSISMANDMMRAPGRNTSNLTQLGRQQQAYHEQHQFDPYESPLRNDAMAAMRRYLQMPTPHKL